MEFHCVPKAESRAKSIICHILWALVQNVSIAFYIFGQYTFCRSTVLCTLSFLAWNTIIPHYPDKDGVTYVTEKSQRFSVVLQ